MALIYLDNNSTTAIVPEVVDAMTACLRSGYLNPASQHQGGRAARRVLQQAKASISRCLGLSLKSADQDQLIVTSGGTEANNLAVRGLVTQPGHVLVSCIEHPSVLAAADSLRHLGCEVELLPVRRSGHVDPQTLREHLRKDTRLVCVMMGNNEVGTLQPIAELAAICREQNVPMHTDAVQVVGKLPINFRDLGTTTFSLAAHKFHGPRGVGALVVREGAHLRPILLGGSQQLGMRPGTESIALVVGMARALECAMEHVAAYDTVARLRDRLQDALIASTGCDINGGDPRLPHTLNASFEGLDRQALVMTLDLADIACSTGSACTSGSSEPSHVLLGMGCSAGLVESSIRLSLSRLTTESEIDLAIDRISKCVNDLRSR